MKLVVASSAAESIMVIANGTPTVRNATRNPERSNPTMYCDDDTICATTRPRRSSPLSNNFVRIREQKDQACGRKFEAAAHTILIRRIFLSRSSLTMSIECGVQRHERLYGRRAVHPPTIPPPSCTPRFPIDLLVILLVPSSRVPYLNEHQSVCNPTSDSVKYDFRR